MRDQGCESEFVACLIPRELYDHLRGSDGEPLPRLPFPLTHVVDPHTGQERRIKQIIYADATPERSKAADGSNAAVDATSRNAPERDPATGCYVSMTYEGGKIVQTCVGSCRNNQVCKQDTSVTSGFTCRCVTEE